MFLMPFFKSLQRFEWQQSFQRIELNSQTAREHLKDSFVSPNFTVIFKSPLRPWLFALSLLEFVGQESNTNFIPSNDFRERSAN